MNTIESKLDRIIEILETAFLAKPTATPIPYDASACQAMVKLSLLTNVRPDELIRLRRCDIYREGDKLPEGYSFPSLNGCWVYIPPGQPKEWPQRFIILNQACQNLLVPYLDSAESDDSPIFSKAKTETFGELVVRIYESLKSGDGQVND